ncbi:hypothetical protein LCI18_012150 [Fusarium solani-melongenae]|uniref:Uncharacterized protein n=1 Tax=Fusarium solani subsp. cucurbitae TaxID=2747967 RepID=A0ACD3ZJD8_FUSSC|nr:hypothetical protein LCI18_012150 [Fusarium solani-melongenae]
MAENRDIAFCFRGWAYDTGKVDRPKRRVIRVSKAHTSRGAKAILAANDTTDAGFVISPKEEDIDLCSATNSCPSGLLAVVVGELLPTVPDYTLFVNSLPLHEFDPSLHTLAETRPDARLVVAIIGRKRCTLHLLHGRRQDGLCEATPLPGERSCDDRVEWTHGVASNRSIECRRAMRHNVNPFCFEFRRVAQEVPQQTPHSPLLDNHVDHGQADEAPTSEEVATFISTVISAYKTFPHKTYLRQVVDRFRQLEQTPLEGLPSPGEASMEIIRDMMEGKGALTETKADGVVHAFKEVWPHQLEAVGEDRINVSAVLELAKALCAISAPGITIHESLYLGVIVSFCTMFSNSHAASRDVGNNLIQSAIRIARGTTLAPVPASPLAQTTDRNPGVALLETLIRENGALVEQFKAWVETGGQKYAPGGILGHLHQMVQLANVIIGTQNQKAIVMVLGQVKPLVLVSAFATVSRLLTLVDGNADIFGAVLQAAVHVVAADMVDKLATQADQESDAVDAQPTLPGLPANLMKLADKVSDMYHALGSVKEESARNAASEAIRDYEENQHGEEAPEPSSTPGLPSSLLRYMRQVLEKECDFPGSQDLDKELAWASRMDWK